MSIRVIRNYKYQVMQVIVLFFFNLLFLSFSQELLTDSSDDRSEYSGILRNVSTRGGRKCRGRRGRVCPGFLKACNAFLACASVLATASLIWLFIDVRQQLTALRTELDQGTKV